MKKTIAIISLQILFSYIAFSQGSIQLGAWTATTSMSSPRNAFTSVAYNGYLYVLGGTVDDITRFNDVQYAPINSDGSVGTWRSTTSFNAGRRSHTSVVYNGYLYVIGGTPTGGGMLNDVQFAPINSDGSLGGWQNTTSFTTGRLCHSSVVYNGYLYIIQGFYASAAAPLTDVQFAKFNPDGSLGAWQSTTTFSPARWGLKSIAYNGHLYSMGGSNWNGSYYTLSDVKYASTNADGTLNSWQDAAPLIQSLDGPSLVAYNGFLIVAGGGHTPVGGMSDVTYSMIGANGSLGPWHNTTPLNSPRSAFGSVEYGGYLYVIGGQDNFGHALDDVQYAKINIIDWTLRLSATAGLASDNNNYLGMSRNATDGFDAVFDTPKPPEPAGDFVQLYFPHPEYGQSTGDNFSCDMRAERALDASALHWKFDVKTDQNNTAVILNFVPDGNIPSGFGMVLNDLTLGKRMNLRQGGMNYAYNSITEDVHHFEILIGDSIRPTVMVVRPNGGEIVRANSFCNISWTASDASGIDSVYVYASANGGTTYEQAASFPGSSSSFSWPTPNAYLNNSGSVRVVVCDSMGNYSQDASDHTITIVGDSLATASLAGWSLVSLPLVPNDSITADIFGSSAYIWMYAQSTGYAQPATVALGNGYWLGTELAKNWYVKGTAKLSDSSVQNLQPGYNLIGNNFVRSVSKSNLFFLKASSYYDFNSAVAAGLISNAIYGYSPSSYSAIDTLTLFGGYWLGVLQSGVQLVEKPNASVTIPLAESPGFLTSNWELPIKVSTSSLTDNIAMIGIKPTATKEFDPLYDAPRPPRCPGGSYLEMYFTHTGGNYPLVLGNKYARDFRDSSSAGWNFAVESSQTGNVTLSWDEALLKGLDGKLNLRLFDMTGGEVIDMSSQAAYTFSYSGARQFMINATTTGIAESSDLFPANYRLSQNFPNPFNPSTSIRYDLPNRSMVRIAVTNSLGQELATLEQGEKEAGYHEVQWTANVASGIYFYHIDAVSVADPNIRFSQTKKMVVLK